MNITTKPSQELRAGSVVVVEEGHRLVKGKLAEARLTQCLFLPSYKAANCWRATVEATQEKVILDVCPYTRRAKLLERCGVTGTAEKGGKDHEQ